MIRLVRTNFSRIVKNPFFAGSLVMVIGSNFHNFGQFVFHFISGKLLGRANYGDLASIISVLGIVSIVQLSVGLTIVRFISAEKDEKKAANLAKWLNWWGIWVGIAIGIVMLILSPFISNFLKISNKQAVYLIGPVLFLLVLTNNRRSILQGLLRFNQYVLCMIAEVWIKILISIPIFLLGYKVFGAMTALLMGVLAAFLVSVFSLRGYLNGKRGLRPDVKPLFSYSIPVFIQGLALTSMYSTDLLLVKHFFSAESAGVYASTAILGRIVFFGASPITNVMFPIVARKHSHGEPYHNIFYSSIVLILIAAAFIVTIYSIFPQQIIGTFFSSEYLEGVVILRWYGIFMALLAVAQLFIQFYLSVGKTKIVGFFTAAAMLQVVLILLMHGSLLQVIQLSIVSVSLLALGLIVYFPYLDRHIRK